MSNGVELGCGLIAIGREWGTTPSVPDESNALRFLEAAYELGVRFFDTAPSYGLSEQRLGLFLSHLTPSERKGVRVATKFGERWDATTNTAYTDHSVDSLKRSLDRSLQLVGSIAVLQLHKTTPELLESDEISEAFDYAKRTGVGAFGASVSDVASADKALHDGRLSFVQLPYNLMSTQFEPVVKDSLTAGKQLIINRPLLMGEATAHVEQEEKDAAIDSAFTFILQEDFKGVVLTGTANVNHLHENWQAFLRVQATL